MASSSSSSFSSKIKLSSTIMKKKKDDWVWKGVSAREPFTVCTILPQLKKEHKHDVKGYAYGASGTVYKINKPDQSGGFVVIKKISHKMDIELEPKEIVEVEILEKIQEKIKHPNIVEMTGYFRSRKNRSTLILYPYFENGSLADCLLQRNQAPPNGSVLDWPTRIRIACGVAQGLQYMHHQCSPAVFHRNLKSSNILLDSDFNPKIADFKSATFVENEVAKTTEQNKEKEFSNFGVILLELLTGQKDKKERQLAKWAHAVPKTSIHDVFDEAVKEPMYQKDTSRVFRVAKWCTNETPEARERLDMNVVLKYLKECDFA